MRRRQVNKAGSAVTEFALTFLLFLTFVFGITEFGRAIWAHNMVSHGAREGSRYAAVRGAWSGVPATSDTVATYVRSRVPGLKPLTVTTSWSPNNQPGSTVVVQVRYDYRPVVPIPLRLAGAGNAFGSNAIAFSNTSRMVIDQ